MIIFSIKWRKKMRFLTWFARPDAELMLMMAPPPRSRMSGTLYLAVSSAEVTFTRITRSHSSSGCQLLRRGVQRRLETLIAIYHAQLDSDQVVGPRRRRNSCMGANG
eukprot:COSAG06_NODE_13891_length_1208_cov_1.575293_1_plen_106_part_10